MAAFAFLIWPFVALALFATLEPRRALIASVLIGYLFLPAAYDIDLEGLPEINKESIVFLSALLGYLLIGRRHAPGTASLHRADRGAEVIFLLLVASIALGQIATSLTNGRPLVIGSTVIPGNSVLDAFKLIFGLALLFGPFFLARRLLAEAESHALILKALVVGGLGYSLLALFEVRMSPQLHVWVYGFFQHGWLQHIRGDGFRPIVFLDHGLSVGFFLFTVIAAAFALSRLSRSGMSAAYVLAGIWTFAVLVLSKNVGALALAALFLPIVALFGLRLQAWVAVAVAVAFLAFPVIRHVDLFPKEQILSVASSISSDRANSLRTRLDNEERLLERWSEKPLFGWGSWGRWRVRDETGRDRTISDGTWIIRLGESGWVGYVGFFGLLTYPIFFLRRARRRKPVGPATMGLALITAGNLIYLVPNSTLSPMSMLIAGALAGFVQYDARRAAQSDDVETTEGRASRYTRFAVRQRPLPEAPTRSRIVRRRRPV